MATHEKSLRDAHPIRKQNHKLKENTKQGQKQLDERS